MNYNIENLPMLSIISAFKNDKNMLKIVMDSVLSQDYHNIEHVIIDSASKDGSVELLKEYTKTYIAKGFNLIWVSEPDNGICEACNKAIKIINGKYLMVLSNPFVSSKSISIFMEHLIEGVYNGISGGQIFQRNGVIIRRWSGRKGKWRFGWMAASETLCIEKSIVEKHGLYNIKYPTAADYDFQLRIFRDKDLKFKTIKIPIVNFLAGGISNKGIAGNFNSIKQDYKILKSQKIYFAWFTLLCKCIRAFFAYTFASRKKLTSELLIKLSN
jgi:glycosyltransferase